MTEALGNVPSPRKRPRLVERLQAGDVVDSALPKPDTTKRTRRVRRVADGRVTSMPSSRVDRTKRTSVVADLGAVRPTRDDDGGVWIEEPPHSDDGLPLPLTEAERARQTRLVSGHASTDAPIVRTRTMRTPSTPPPIPSGVERTMVLRSPRRDPLSVSDDQKILPARKSDRIILWLRNLFGRSKSTETPSAIYDSRIDDIRSDTARVLARSLHDRTATRVMDASEHGLTDRMSRFREHLKGMPKAMALAASSSVITGLMTSIVLTGGVTMPLAIPILSAAVSAGFTAFFRSHWKNSGFAKRHPILLNAAYVVIGMGTGASVGFAAHGIDHALTALSNFWTSGADTLSDNLTPQLSEGDARNMMMSSAADSESGNFGKESKPIGPLGP